MGSKCVGIDKISEKFYQQYQVVLDSMVSRCLFSPSHHKKSNGLAKVHSFAGPFCFCTISNWPHHSPQVWGNPSAQRGILRAWRRLRRQRALPMVVPLHPHMRKRLKEQGLWTMASRCTLLDPLGYVDLLSLAGGAAFVVTDSGGLRKKRITQTSVVQWSCPTRAGVR